MFGFGICYLNGWSMAAADGAKKERAEWPPHPDRVFMALAAAHFETDGGREERAALEWLEQQGPPSLCVSEAEFRSIVTTYVPVNDSANPLKKEEAILPIMGSLPIGRDRKPRSFPVAIPHNPVVYLVWGVPLPQMHRSPLVALSRKVISIGHSASFVQMWIEDTPPAPTLVPVGGVARYRLRVQGKGRLHDLETRCNRKAVIQYRDLVSSNKERLKELENQRKAASKELRSEEKRKAEAPFKEEIDFLKKNIESAINQGEPFSLRPIPVLWQGYDTPPSLSQSESPHSVFDPQLVVLTLSGKRLSLPITLKLTEALRGAVMSGCAKQPPPEWLTGHAAHGARTDKPHVAFIPLPFVGCEHADGRIMGVALALPHELDPDEISPCLEPWLRDEQGLPRRIRLFAGQWLECEAELETRELPPWSLCPETWTKPSRFWATVTPVVLDRHFDGKGMWEKAAETIMDACERIGLPRPLEVLLNPVSRFEGVPHVREFPHVTRKSDGGQMYHSHAIIIFDKKMTGPVVLGAGRFRGYGLCRPLNEGGEG